MKMLKLLSIILTSLSLVVVLGCDRNGMDNIRKELRAAFSPKDKVKGRPEMPGAKEEPDDSDKPMNMVLDSDGKLPQQERGAEDTARKKKPLGEEDLELADQAELGPDDLEEDSVLEPAFSEDEEAKPRVKKPDEEPDDLGDEDIDSDDKSELARKEKAEPAPEAKGGAKKVVEKAGPKLNCPEKGITEGKAPPDGYEQWCADKSGNRHGAFYKWHRNGEKKLEGNFVHGKPEGIFVTYSNDGQKIESRQYKNGLLNGLSVKWSSTGQKSLEMTYADGKKNGPFVSYDRSGGKKLQGAYLNDQKNGVWIIFTRNGSPRSKTTWKEGKKSGKYEQFFASGEPSSIANYVNGKLEGPYISFGRDGRKKKEGLYVAGQKHGTWTQYRRDGQVARVAKFDHGARVDRDNGGRRSQETGFDDSSLEDQYHETKRRALRRDRRRPPRERGRDTEQQRERTPKGEDIEESEGLDEESSPAGAEPHEPAGDEEPGDESWESM